MPHGATQQAPHPAAPTHTAPPGTAPALAILATHPMSRTGPRVSRGMVWLPPPNFPEETYHEPGAERPTAPETPQGPAESATAPALPAFVTVPTCASACLSAWSMARPALGGCD